MPTKTDRILSYLPGTFQTSPRPPVLYAVADAFGNELQLGENSLSAVMLSHWVDFADKSAPTIDDLRRIGALYGLAPRDDESVEEFRDHLKRYVRTFLDGTVTAQGILRVTAEVLGLRIADSDDDLDVWWKRRESELVTVAPIEDDGAPLLLGEGARSGRGSPARRAEIVGSVTVDGIDLGTEPHLRISTDAFGAKDVALPPGVASLQSIVEAIKSATGATCARPEGPHLVVGSPTIGPGSRLEVLEGANDAAPQILGLAPRTYSGSPAVAAELTSPIDLGAGVDLTDERYLRLAVDASHFAEVDCADPAATLTGLDHIRDAINSALGIPVASHQGGHLTLRSPTKGSRSTVAVQRATAQDAATRIFGRREILAAGGNDQPARVTGSRDLSGGVDLTRGARLLLTVDGTTETVDVAGADPAHTQTIEVVTAINEAFRARVAGPDGNGITISSPTVGPAAQIVVGTPPNGDATDAILGIRPRTSEGAPPTSARIVGRTDLGRGVNVMARRYLSLAVDGARAVQVDLQSGPADPRNASLAEIVTTINLAVPKVASDDGSHLLLASPTTGAASRLELGPRQTTLRRRFVTRAFVTSEASDALLGFISRTAQGTPATHASIVGTPDLSFGVDLREERYLRIVVDGRSFEVDCAGDRPRATLLAEIVSAINAAAPAVAAHDEKHLILTSPTAGAAGSLDLEAPLQRDALASVLGVPPGTTRGQDSTRVIFTGLVDLSAGLDLPANASIRLAIDGEAAKEVALCGPAPAHISAAEIAGAINVTMGAAVALVGGNRLVLGSSARGSASKIEFLTPAGTDATTTVFGIAAPRSYRGADARPPRVVGKELPPALNLQVSRFLRAALDGAPPRDVDCASEAAHAAAVEPSEVVKAINKALGPGIASLQGARLVLTSPTAGSAGRIEFLPFSSGDARQKLLGDLALPVQGVDTASATITGTTVISGPVDLSRRRSLRLAINGADATDIDVAGKFPERTSLGEVVAAINRAVPGVASMTEEGALRLVAPATDGTSSLSVLPLRSLELVEYPPVPYEEAPRALSSGQGFSLVNGGAAASSVEISLTARSGAAAPAIVNITLSRRLRVLTHLDAGDTARLWADEKAGIAGEIRSSDGRQRRIASSEILAGPLGSHASVPFSGSRVIVGNPPAIQLDDPAGRSVVVLRARDGFAGGAIRITVTESDVSGLPPAPTTGSAPERRLAGRVRFDKEVASLVDASEKTTALLRGGPDVHLDDFENLTVEVAGSWFDETPPLMVVKSVGRLFDVTLTGEREPGKPLVENYAGVTIGLDREPSSLLVVVNAGRQDDPASKLVTASEFDRESALELPQGRSDWLYLDCLGSRYNHASFDQDHFPDGHCREVGVFDVSAFASVPEEPADPVFASASQPPDSTTEVSLRWRVYQPGSFVVNLPADLPHRFGAKFNQGRFGQADGSPERYTDIVTEPAGDDRFITDVINGRQSDFVRAELVQLVPLGWTMARMPFRKPQFLSLGADDVPAYLYLAEEGLSGFIQLEAVEPGAWGNGIAVTARKSGPAVYDVEIRYQASRFENARSVVLGTPLAAAAQELLKPGPVGVLQAKAAGVLAAVTRDAAQTMTQ